MAESRWVVLPVGQQANGAWVDAIRTERLRESPIAGLTFEADASARTRVEIYRGDDFEAQVNERFHRRGWTDGLPIVAPTVYRVQQMLRDSPIGASDIVDEVDPLRGVATAEKLAANAVMAGCLPEYFPVVLAVTRAIVDPVFNLRGVQTTDENVAPLVIVSGPAAAKLGINARIGALGPGWRANATIGRAIRLIMTNIGGGWPGVVSIAGIGQAGRYTLCLAEREQSPWPLLHVESGLDAAESAVTVLRAECAINVTGGLDDIASVMGTAASAFGLLRNGCVAVLIAPHTAAALAAQGWSKADVARYLHENGRVPVETWRRMWIRNEIAASAGVPDWVKRAEQEGVSIPVVESPEQIIVFVAGGDAPIAQHVYFPTWGFPVCRLVVPIKGARGWVGG